MSSGEKKPYVFGVRHLSPGGAYHLRQFLEEIKPTAVLIEGPSDANPQIASFTVEETKPPLAILAYTEALPVRTLLYPFAVYSPEYQALLWARQHGAHAEFIDLPSGTLLALEEQECERQQNKEQQSEKQRREKQGKRQYNEHTSHHLGGEALYEKWAELGGEEDYPAYWEYNFEHNLKRDVYRLTAYEVGKSLRELLEDDPYEIAKNLVREAYMRSRISKTMTGGHEAEKIVVVTGAYHASALTNLEPLAEKEREKLPHVNTRLTLMPYSYYRLSSKSGYGAGNNAPAYYELMWEAMNRQDLTQLPAEYLSKIAAYLRESGTPRSAAEVIEGLRLANALAALHAGSAPALRDLRDAAVICLGNGELSVVAEAIAQTETGTAIGSLPEGVSCTSIQDDFYRELKKLKLEKYQAAVAMSLKLDLRENRRVQSQEAVFLDLNRSFFLHRLKVLNISFQQFCPSFQQGASWAESWILRWTPEAEIELVEATLQGETVELATAFVFKERLEKSSSIQEAAEIIREACECGMPEAMAQARASLQRLAVDAGSFNEIAGAAYNLSLVISYGGIRKFDTAPLLPLLQQLFLRGTLLLGDAANCDHNAARDVLAAIDRMNVVATEHFQLDGKPVDEALWIKKLQELADADDRNPLLSGYACSLLLERNLLDEDTLAQEVSRRLSPGIDAVFGAGWFEGLSLRNHYALLAKRNLWEQLALYVASLDEEQFKPALVFLRRAFSSFSSAEKCVICENLGEIWGVAPVMASDLLQRELTEEEQNRLKSLEEFDFDGI